MFLYEIIYYYENYDWKCNFINQNDGLEVVEQLEKFFDGFKYEMQADYFGGVLVIFVGYNIYSMFVLLLEKVYVIYGLFDEI